MSTVYRCIQCSLGTFGNRRPPAPKCPCGGEWEGLRHMGGVPGTAPDGVAQRHRGDGTLFYYWLRSWRGDWGWDHETTYLVRIPPPDVPHHIHFLDLPKRAKVIKVGMVVACPTCGAAEGVQCKRPSEHQSPFKDMHAERKDRADAVFFWQYGAGACIVADAEGRPMVKTGLDRTAERRQMYDHRERGIREAKRRGTRLPAAPTANDVDVERLNAPALGGADTAGQLLIF